MDLPVAVFVAIVAASVVVGILLATLVDRWRRYRKDQRDAAAVEEAAVLRAELDEAVRSSRRELEKSNTMRAERDRALAQVEQLTAELEAACRRISEQADEVALTRREADDLRTRFSDIVGLEAEIAAYRALAARVPELERRLAAAEGTPRDVIDLRAGAEARD